MNQARLIAYAVAVVAMTATFVSAQGGRGAGPARGPGAAALEHIVVHSKALEGVAGDSTDREVTVYLPPSYRSDQTRRYPVVYLLHDFAAGADAFTGRLANLPASADRLAAAAGFSAPIIVIPNALRPPDGGLSSNSPRPRREAR